MKKIDLHVHCMRTPPAPAMQQEFGGWTGPEKMREYLRTQGIGHAVLQSCGEYIPGKAEQGTNLDCYKIAEQYPDFYHWMCNPSPEGGGTVAQRLEEWKKQGAIGVGELMVNRWLDDPFLKEVFSAAQALEMPVTIHMSPEPGFRYGVCDRPGLPLLEKTLEDHPDLKILGHSQMFWLEISGDCPREGLEARTQWGSGAVTPGGRVPYLFENYPNLYGDLSAFSGSCAILRDREFGLAFLERYSERLFFATDTVNDQQKFPLGEFLDEAVASGQLSRSAYENICFRNARRVFSLKPVI